MCDSPRSPVEHQKSACSGKCRGDCRLAAPRFHVAAASHGTVCLFEWQGEELAPCAATGPLSPEGLAHYLRAHAEGRQLILVGSPTDLAWLHASIPVDAPWGIAAEIPYPLLAGWLTEPGQPQLIQTLRQLLP